MSRKQTAKPSSKRRRNALSTRTKLLRATMQLVSEKGAAALSVKEAARRAKVSRGVAYLHFEDRDELLKTAKSWVSKELQSVVSQFEGAPLHQRTLQATRIILGHPAAAKLLVDAAMSGTDLDRAHPLYKLVLKLLEELKTRGRARPDIDVEIVAYIMFGSIAATLIMGAQHKGEDLGRLAERFALEWDHVLAKGMFARAVRYAAHRRSKRPPRKAAKQ